MRKILLMMALVVCTAAQAGKVVTDSINSRILGTWVKYVTKDRCRLWPMN